VSPCQICSKSVKARPRHGDFSIFQDGGRRHLECLIFLNFNGRNPHEDETASLCQISSKSVKPRPKYGNFPIFLQMAAVAAAAILDFQNFKFLTVGRLKRVEVRCRAKFGPNRSNRGRDMTIFLFSKMAAAAILDF